jgi:CheY-like chemotaxis protein
MKMKKILVAEDNKLIQQTIAYKLVKDGFDVITVDDGKACLEMLENNDIDLLITDLFMQLFQSNDSFPGAIFFIIFFIGPWRLHGRDRC